MLCSMRMRLCTTPAGDGRGLLCIRDAKSGPKPSDRNPFDKGVVTNCANFWLKSRSAGCLEVLLAAVDLRSEPTAAPEDSLGDW